MAQLTVDGAVLLSRLRELGAIGVDHENGGRTRVALSDDEKAGRDLLVKWMKEEGLEITVDQIGNIIGTLRADTHDKNDLGVMIGSHIDTVINAGHLDGCYGVLSGLAVVRAFRTAGIVPSRPISVTAFTNEEGVRYHPDMMGSMVFSGVMSLEDALNAKGEDGSRVGDELVRIGYAGEEVPGQRLPHEYFELHIEQGPVLDAEGIQIGVVDSLQGISWHRVTVEGKANHAGTTPTHMRKDAGLAAAALNLALREISLASGSTVTNVGTFRLEPNAVNVVPRKAVFTIDMREPNEDKLRDAEKKLEEKIAEISASHGVTITREQLVRTQPVVFNAQLVDAIEQSVKGLNLSYKRMTSGAGHDAQMVARVAPAAMIFVPSKDGISHNPREHTDDDQLIVGANVLLDVIRQRVS